jgi:hypothetical protein
MLMGERLRSQPFTRISEGRHDLERTLVRATVGGYVWDVLQCVGSRLDYSRPSMCVSSAVISSGTHCRSYLGFPNGRDVWVQWRS